MTPTWQNIAQQIVFFFGVFALAIAALQESHLAPQFQPSANIVITQIATTENLAQP